MVGPKQKYRRVQVTIKTCFWKGPGPEEGIRGELRGMVFWFLKPAEDRGFGDLSAEVLWRPGQR